MSIITTFSIFQGSGRPPSWICKFLKFNGGSGQEERAASLCQISSKSLERGRYTAIYRFFLDVGRPPSRMRVLGPPTKDIWWSVSLCKICWNRCSGFDNMHVFRFREFGLKTPIHASKLGVFGIYDSLNREQCEKFFKKAHPCASPRHLSHHA